jgi:hypothetical protein
MADENKTEKFELEVSMGVTVTIIGENGQPTWLRPATAARHTWPYMPTPQEIQLRYRDMVDITTATLEDGLGDAYQRARDAKEGNHRHSL